MSSLTVHLHTPHSPSHCTHYLYDWLFNKNHISKVFHAMIFHFRSLYFYYHILSLLALMYFVCIKNQNTRPNFTGEFSGSQWQNHQSMDQSIATKSVSVPDIVVRITRPEGIWQPTRVPRMKSAKGTRRHKRRSDSVWSYWFCTWISQNFSIQSF